MTSCWSAYAISISCCVVMPPIYAAGTSEPGFSENCDLSCCEGGSVRGLAFCCQDS
jgi:hypothetical protein